MTQINRTTTFAVADPRNFDGDPYEVAARAVLQAGGMARLLASVLEGARVMARNAEMERQIALDAPVDVTAAEQVAHIRQLQACLTAAEQIAQAAEKIARAAAYNPKARIGRD